MKKKYNKNIKLGVDGWIITIILYLLIPFILSAYFALRLYSYILEKIK